MKRTESDMTTQTMEAATQWLLRLRDENASEQDIAAWLNWYDENDENKRAFGEMQALWGQVGGLAQGSGGAERIKRLGRMDLPAGGLALRVPASRFRRRAGWIASVAAVCAVVYIGIGLRPERVAPPRAAAPSELVRARSLPDGSRMELAARTDVTVHYTERERLLEMQEGAAYFTVAENRARPFVVQVGAVKVRAVGTAFNIRRAGPRIEVTVTEGVVEVLRPAGGQSAATIRVKAGHTLSLANPSDRPQVALAPPARALAWREGRLEYIGEPLSSVIADVNRYAGRPVVIRDPAVAKLTFTGTVFVGSVEDWLQALPGQFPLELVVRGETRLLVASASLPDR